MPLPRWINVLAVALTVLVAALLLLDWVTDERIGDWALYFGGAVLAFLMVLSLATVLRSRAARLSSDRLPLKPSSDHDDARRHR